MAMDLPLARDLGELDYTRRLDKLYQMALARYLSASPWAGLLLFRSAI